MGSLNFNSASKFAFSDLHNSTMYSQQLTHTDSIETAGSKYWKKNN